jgi:hypothetical protein
MMCTETERALAADSELARMYLSGKPPPRQSALSLQPTSVGLAPAATGYRPGRRTGIRRPAGMQTEFALSDGQQGRKLSLPNESDGQQTVRRY